VKTRYMRCNIRVARVGPHLGSLTEIIPLTLPPPMMLAVFAVPWDSELAAVTDEEAAAAEAEEEEDDEPPGEARSGRAAQFFFAWRRDREVPSMEMRLWWSPRLTRMSWEASTREKTRAEMKRIRMDFMMSTGYSSGKRESKEWMPVQGVK
jgi:hypothetical protein